MTEAMGTSRADVSQFAPRLYTMKINPEKIRDVIGKGGATIRALTEETGCTIDIAEDGTITIASTEAEKAEFAKKRITEITAEVEVGKVYEGPITKLLDFGALGVLKLGERPDPVPGAGELLVRVRASGVNRPDVLQRTGNYPVPPGASDIPGLEVAGEIAGGDAKELAAAGFKIGDRVCALVAGGGYAELCVAPIGQCLPVPRGLTDVEA